MLFDINIAFFHIQLLTNTGSVKHVYVYMYVHISI